MESCAFFLVNMLHKYNAGFWNSSRFQSQRQCWAEYFCATSSHNHNVKDKRKPFKRSNSTSSSSTSNAAPLNRRNQNHSQGAPLTVQELPSPVILKGIATAALTLMGMGFTTETCRNFQTGDHSHRSHNGRYMDLRQQRGFGMMTPHMLMGQPLAWLNSKLWKLRYSG